jgi:hypothetical protein
LVAKSELKGLFGRLRADRRIITKCSKSYMFENRMLSRIFEPKRDEVNRGLSKLHNEEVHSLHSLPSTCIIKMIKSRSVRWAGYIYIYGKERNAYRILVGKPEGKRPVGIPRHRWEDNIMMED